MFQNSYEVIDYITKRTKRTYGLSEFRKFMQDIGNPQDQLRCIHVGGTNGKGSTTNYIRSILQQAGYKVGTFTSPHLETHHDRIRINDQSISDEDLVRYANQYVNQWEAYGVTMFEIDMFISVMYFLENQVDYAIYEVGLGGELDATNIINPLLSVITTIGYDHMDYLGNTIEEITRAKAGIIKHQTPLITHERKDVCITIMREVCEEKQAELIEVKDAEKIQYGKEIIFDYQNLSNLKICTYAHYQVENACNAIEVCLWLRDHQVLITDEQIRQGLKEANWKGRFELVHENPLVFLDGAHNEHGMMALVDTVKQMGYSLTIVFSALRDKETDKMLEMLLSVSDDIIVTEFTFYRAKPADALAGNYPVQVVYDWKEAIATALSHQKEMVLITGSLYFISDVRSYLKTKGWV